MPPTAPAAEPRIGTPWSEPQLRSKRTLVNAPAEGSCGEVRLEGASEAHRLRPSHHHPQARIVALSGAHRPARPIPGIGHHTVGVVKPVFITCVMDIRWHPVVSPADRKTDSDHRTITEAPLNPKEEFRPTTPDGTDLRVATSALIKALRRGEEAEAGYWALQLEPRYWRYLWRRLAIFTAEDIGIAAPETVTLIASLRAMYGQAKEESRSPRPDGSLLGLAVLTLARAPKNREASEFIEAIGHLITDEGWRPDVGPEVFDLHTSEGRERMPDSNQRLSHWLQEAAHSNRDEGPKDWVLWISRWAARRGALQPDSVERAARDWERAGRLVHGIDGYASDRVYGGEG